MYIPNPKHIKDDFYAVAETGWRPVNKKARYCLPRHIDLSPGH